MQILRQLWSDKSASILSTELVMVASVAVMGLVVGLDAVRQAVLNEMADLATAIQSVNQSFATGGVVGHSASSAGSSFTDSPGPIVTIDAPLQAQVCVNFQGIDFTTGQTEPAPTTVE